ncbi:MAG: hypothetical protein J6A48_08955, partial [Clostridia bacterium]|nr:hypothetical protein [Clostridia bacterium]
MYQQGYQDGPNGNGQDRAWYAAPPRTDAPAPRRRSRSRAQSEQGAGTKAPSQASQPVQTNGYEQQAAQAVS